MFQTSSWSLLASSSLASVTPWPPGIQVYHPWPRALSLQLDTALLFILGEIVL